MNVNKNYELFFKYLLVREVYLSWAVYSCINVVFGWEFVIALPYIFTITDFSRC